jgi:glycosyltransferase involved in cell wall biosynthesis
VSDSTEIGGAERFLHHLLSELPADVDVVAFATSADVLAHVVAGRPSARAEVVTDDVRGFRRALVRAAPDIVHLNLITFTSCRAAAIASVIERLPIVLVDHAPMPGLTWRGRAVQRVLTRLSALRIAPGSGAARNAERYGGLRSGTVRAVPNGVPEPGCSVAALAERPFMLGALARLDPAKGIDILLQAMVDMPGAVALVAGDGVERERLVRLAADLGVSERVQFLGWAQSPCDILTKVHVLVVPSRSETMTLAVLEAMHAGLPVVVADVGSLREAVLDGETGLVVPPEDPQALAQACRQLGADPGLRARLGTAARERARREYTVAIMAARYDAHYRALLGFPPRPAQLSG